MFSKVLALVPHRGLHILKIPQSGHPPRVDDPNALSILLIRKTKPHKSEIGAPTFALLLSKCSTNSIL